jgi:hypothetical protein
MLFHKSGDAGSRLPVPDGLRFCGRLAQPAEKKLIRWTGCQREETPSGDRGSQGVGGSSNSETPAQTGGKEVGEVIARDPMEQRGPVLFVNFRRET